MFEERQRLLQDLHDGMGHELFDALLLARSDDAPREAVAAQIQRAIDHFRLTVDALQPDAGDMGVMLGSLRHRLCRQMGLAGISLEWCVGVLPPMAGWSAAHSRELQLLLYEAFSNLLQHSGARRACLEAGFSPRGSIVTLALRDDGCGLHAAASHGQGIASMRSRAARLGARLAMRGGDPAYPGLRLELRIPAPQAAPSGLQGRRTSIRPACTPSNTASPREVTCSLR